jgi:hypothetical protein
VFRRKSVVNIGPTGKVDDERASKKTKYDHWNFPCLSIPRMRFLFNIGVNESDNTTSKCVFSYDKYKKMYTAIAAAQNETFCQFLIVVKSHRFRLDSGGEAGGSPYSSRKPLCRTGTVSGSPAVKGISSSSLSSGIGPGRRSVGRELSSKSSSLSEGKALLKRGGESSVN